MLETIIRFICFLVFAIVDLLLLKDILDYKKDILNIKTVLLILLLSIISIVSYKEFYSINATVVRIVANIIIYGIILETDFYKIIVTFLILMIITLLCDLIVTSLSLTVITPVQLRTDCLCTLIANFLVGLLVFIITNFPPIKNKIKTFASNLKKADKIQTVTIYILVFISIISLFYNITNLESLNPKFIINSVVIFSFIVIALVFLIDKNNYNSLVKRYDSLFTYVQNLEDSIDNINLNNHEYKNQLSMLKEYISNSDKKNSLKILDEMIKETKNKDNNILSKLKLIPKGGIKGLLYYKILLVNKNNLNFCIDVSNKVISKLKKLNLEETKIICSLIGIYFDNAIDSSMESRKKLLSLEIYSLNDDIDFVFCNTFKQKNIDLNKVETNGYTTKGKGHGQGLYLAKKIILKNNWIDAETSINNNLYIQKLIIKGK